MNSAVGSKRKSKKPDNNFYKPKKYKYTAKQSQNLRAKRAEVQCEQ